jgi:sodium-coupled neutral amino acid transporter 11
MISYNIVIGDTWSKLMVRLTKLPPTHAVCRREFVIVVLTLLCTLPMSLYRNIAKLSKISLISVIFLALILVIIVLRYITLSDLM